MKGFQTWNPFFSKYHHTPYPILFCLATLGGVEKPTCADIDQIIFL